MNKDSENPRQSPAVRRRKTNSSQTQQSPAAAKDGRTRARKRKASPEKETPKKRKRVSKSKPGNTTEEEGVGGKRVKRKLRECGEGPSQKKRKKESASSSSVDTRRKSSNPLEGCSTSLCPRGVKRKASADGEGPTKKRKRSLDVKEAEEKTEEDLSSSVEARRAEFEAKYEEKHQLGEGGCGSVFAGSRRADDLPVAIKHIPDDKVFLTQTDKKGNQLSVEVAVMLKLGMSGSAVSLLDWYDLDEELILVLERPVPAVDLFEYNANNGGCLEEEEAKIILKQLLEATIQLQDENVFHRDIKMENILIETGADVPRVRLIDFGLSCFAKRGTLYRVFYGTSCHVPPEWYSRSAYKAGPTTVWQLGVVLYEIVHRKSSFETVDFLSDKMKISDKLSSDCQDFLQICLTKVPEQRATLEQLQRHPWLR